MVRYAARLSYQLEAGGAREGGNSRFSDAGASRSIRGAPIERARGFIKDIVGGSIAAVAEPPGQEAQCSAPWRSEPVTGRPAGAAPADGVLPDAVHRSPKPAPVVTAAWAASGAKTWAQSAIHTIHQRMFRRFIARDCTCVNGRLLFSRVRLA